MSLAGVGDHDPAPRGGGRRGFGGPDGPRSATTANPFSAAACLIGEGSYAPGASPLVESRSVRAQQHRAESRARDAATPAGPPAPRLHCGFCAPKE